MHDNYSKKGHAHAGNRCRFRPGRHDIAALQRLATVLKKMSSSVREKLAIENDDRTYTPQDFLGFCKENEVPFVNDVHHHRCLRDGLSVEHVTEAALTTWNRLPLFNVSSHEFGLDSSKPSPHHDYINIRDFPVCWRDLSITVEVQAKAKELAVKKLSSQLTSFTQGTRQ